MTTRWRAIVLLCAPSSMRLSQSVWLQLSRRLSGRAPLAYLVAGGMSVAAAIGFLRLWDANLRVPFDYGGDALLFQYLVKSVVDHGWYWTNPSVGAPNGLDLGDFPFAAHDSFHLLVIKLLSLFTHDWGLIFNLYFLLGFPLITWSAMAVFRHFNVSYSSAIAGAVLYAFLPTRLLKGEAHIFLTVFYQVPLAVMLLLWVCGEAPPLVETRGPSLRLEARRARSVGALFICALTASTSLYYAFFTTCLLVAGGVWASIERRSLRNAAAGAVLAGATIVGLAANGLPTMIHEWRYGLNDVAARKTGEAEVYGMKLAQLLLPVEGHRVPALRQLTHAYNASAPLVGENATDALGFAGDVGFLWLLGLALVRGRGDRAGDNVLRPLTALNLLAVLLGTIGGLGALFALLVTPQIRSYSRVCVFIGFFSIFALVLLLERLNQSRPRLGAVAPGLILALGLLDQVSLQAVRDYAGGRKKFESDADFVHRIEQSVPQATTIFELPYMPFPNTPPLHDMSSFESFRPYLHSWNLRWSYPTMHGRSPDAFASEVSERGGKMLETLAAVGFGGVLVNRDGYPDDGAAIEAEFLGVLGVQPMTSKDGRLAFYDLAAYRRRVKELPPLERDHVLHPLFFSFVDGFYGLEHSPGGTFRWSKSKSELRVENELPAVRRASIRMTLSAASPPARLTAAGELLSAAVELSGGGVQLVRQIEVPPGRHVIRFACDGRHADAPSDPRTLVWRIENFGFDELPAEPR